VFYLTECGLSNLAQCLPEMFFEFLVSLLNGALQSLLDVVYFFLTNTVNPSLLLPIWEIMIYVLSMFYGIFLISAGFNLMISGYDVKKREKAKGWLGNVLFMVISVQGSYFWYILITNIAGSMTGAVFNLISSDFFLVNSMSSMTLGFTLASSVVYSLVLILTILFLGIQYLVVFSGVLIFPFGLFFYFIPMLRSYGMLIIHSLIAFIFIPFFMSLQLLVASKIFEVIVSEIDTLLWPAISFLAADFLMLFVIVAVVLKAGIALELL